jgi:biopolymer transport protein TolR
MAMTTVEARGSVAEINVTPLIDVLLVLLIIFMVIVPVIPSGMESAVPKPAGAAAEADAGPVLLEVRSGGSTEAAPRFRIDGDPVEASALAQALRAKLSTRQMPALILSADRSLTYNDVALAVSEARAAGAWPIGLGAPPAAEPRGH